MSISSLVRLNYANLLFSKRSEDLYTVDVALAADELVLTVKYYIMVVILEDARNFRLLSINATGRLQFFMLYLRFGVLVESGSRFLEMDQLNFHL